MNAGSPAILSIAYDSEALKGYETGWGFSAVIKTRDQNILFDCGWDGHLLRRNLGRLGYSLADFGTVVLSHSHWDHMGGLSEVLQDAPMDRSLVVMLHEGFSENLRNEIRKKAEVVLVSRAQEIASGIWSTGMLGKDTKEQALVVQTGSRIAVITGCAHPGIHSILEAASQLGSPVCLIGGFHAAPANEFPRQLEQLVICHCTRMKQELLRDFARKASVGLVGASYELLP
jgi:7,8-dihydropterin-6-yl-methyl-4-(beta-D-ribofuranosyl)aminobenzene 5'-phosphate synthase